MSEDNKKKTFIIYQDENGEQQESWVDNLIIENSFVTFNTLNNKIMIPSHRVIKIKEKNE